MSRSGVDLRRGRQAVTKLVRHGLLLGACVFIAAAAPAEAMPGAEPGAVVRLKSEIADRPLIRTGVCADDDEVCLIYQSEVHPPRRDGTRRWEPEPLPYVHDEPRAKPDCVEERYAARAYVRQTPPEVRRRVVESYDDICGVRCWYKKLRAGYCGLGCDYYRFRMTQFPEGKLGNRHIQVACR